VVIVLAWTTSLLVTIHVHSACGGLAGDGGHGGCWLNFETLKQLDLKVRWVLLRENFGCAWVKQFSEFRRQSHHAHSLKLSMQTAPSLKV
jgi:hypothetical protein